MNVNVIDLVNSSTNDDRSAILTDSFSTIDDQIHYKLL